MRPVFQILIVSFFILGYSCSYSPEILDIPYSHPEIKYSGRIDSSATNGVGLYWSGSMIEMNFEGTAVEACFKDETGDNYYNVFVDESMFLLKPDTLKEFVQLAANLVNGPHSLKIFKRTEWDRGQTNFFGFKISGNGRVLAKPAIKKRKIEFYGNSITAGYGVDDTSGKDRSDSIFTNNYKSYSNLTAQHFDAEYRCICRSGIGITISWFPTIMPEVYNRIDPRDSTSVYDFSNYTPEVVVVNLFQNDSWLVHRPEMDVFKKYFGDTPPTEEFIIKAYKDFIEKIRGHYPEAYIFCILGNMDITREKSPWPGYVEQAVAHLDDPKIHTHFIPYKNTPGHPSVEEQKVLANSLIKCIEEKIKW